MSKDTEMLPPIVREYVTALDTWNLAAAEWLGLDPDEVFDLDITQDGGEVRGAWKSVSLQSVRLGGDEAAVTFGDERTTYEGTFALRGQDAVEFNDAVGPRPDLLTPSERERLERIARA